MLKDLHNTINVHRAAHAHRPYKSFLQTLIRIFVLLLLLLTQTPNTSTVGRLFRAFRQRGVGGWKFSIPTAAEWDDEIFHHRKENLPDNRHQHDCRKVWENFPFRLPKQFCIQHFLTNKKKFVKFIDFSLAGSGECCNLRLSQKSYLCRVLMKLILLEVSCFDLFLTRDNVTVSFTYILIHPSCVISAVANNFSIKLNDSASEQERERNVNFTTKAWLLTSLLATTLNWISN